MLTRNGNYWINISDLHNQSHILWLHFLCLRQLIIVYKSIPECHDLYYSRLLLFWMTDRVIVCVCCVVGWWWNGWGWGVEWGGGGGWRVEWGGGGRNGVEWRWGWVEWGGVEWGGWWWWGRVIPNAHATALWCLKTLNSFEIGFFFTNSPVWFV